ncbi:PhzF family phenazine biosynthesis protein [Alteromonas ponticola]|uniref:PhzF family phenazine biosynthesis protein n=1 Tax=Alteromonas ponticola TaxID=2720613 RepID=A0ABX1R0T8_9ALTE|nr:PhzF family phenazine biosynthesis protein [Alteromonas ponticola]NMH60089.1 PhzF family phenazine biosynthesis protein [Alteromonas ponticola]
MEIQRIAAFSVNGSGGNPAGVMLLDNWIDDSEMARIAADVGYSETAFAVAQDSQQLSWRVRYFSPESEVPFCGHATIALGVVLGKTIGSGSYTLDLNHATITVDAEQDNGEIIATLVSPPTRSQPLTETELVDMLHLFSLQQADLHPTIPPARIHGGADHIVLPLHSRQILADMHYQLDEGRRLMRQHELVTVMLVYVENNQTFVARNAFASGGVLEDPATGAAAAAFAGYLRDIEWPHQHRITIRQGDDMGQPSLIKVTITQGKGQPVKVSGRARVIG